MSAGVAIDLPEPLYKDAFGGAIYFIEFGMAEEENDDELAQDLADRAEDDIASQDDEADAAELDRARKATCAHLVIHSNGHEEWTTSGLEFARQMLANNTKRPDQMGLFE